jgi:Xaa-Pro aminopeptidase
LKGHIALAEAVFPEGTAGSQLDAFARRHLWAAGLDYDHGTGHGVGSRLCVHEGPQRIAKRGGDVKLEAGMILSNEPGNYPPGAYGIRIENLMLVVERGMPAGGDLALLGFEVLTMAPIDHRLVEPELMTAEELAWLDAYHARVRARLAPELDAADRAWLEAATAPLGRAA